jgi:hypothetical protein
MAGPTTKRELLASIRDGHARWSAVLAEVPRARMTEPGLPGGWSVKDVLAHIAWGQREAVGLVRARALVGSELWRLSDDERNAIVVAQNRGRPLDEVLEESARVFRDYLAAVEGLSEEELNDPRHFAGMPGDWRPWRTVHDPEHYAHHTADLRAWLDAKRRSA